ncbi:MAG: AsmA family protein [Planctomycetota bacterium]
MSRRKIVFTMLVLAVIGTAGWLLWHTVGRRFVHESVARVERWCGRQLQAIANDHLGPTLSFDTLDYDYPRTVTLTPVRLTADGVSIITADSIRIDFAEIPGAGRPVVIEAAVFDRPVVRLIEQADGSLLGFADFVKTGGGQSRPDGGSTRLSDVLDITKLQVADGALSFEPLDGPPMRLRPLTFELDHQPHPAGGAAADAGWYAFDVTMAVEPVVRLDVDARLNLDSVLLDVASAVVNTSLTTAQYEVFTPEIQDFLRQYGIVGDLHWTLSGQVPLRDTASSAIETQLRLNDASVSFGEYVLPVETLHLLAKLSEGLLDVHECSIESLGGTAQSTFQLRVAGPQSGAFEVQGEGQNIRLEQALQYEEGVEARLRGNGTFQVEARGSFEDLDASFGGQGDIAIREARLQLVDLFRGALGIKGRRQDKDYATADFELTPDRVRWSHIKVGGNAIGINGDGDLFYDGRLDCLFNVGPLQGREGVLGAIGDTVGIVTDSLVRYALTGTVNEPKIAVKPLHIRGGKKDEPDTSRR